jgi:hypothetical protein
LPFQIFRPLTYLVLLPLLEGVPDGLLGVVVSEDTYLLLEVFDPVGDTFVLREELGVEVLGSRRKPQK